MILALSVSACGRRGPLQPPAEQPDPPPAEPDA
ncbi:MAG: lipoprotein [Rhodothalassiaceae bacterium]